MTSLADPTTRTRWFYFDGKPELRTSYANQRQLALRDLGDVPCIHEQLLSAGCRLCRASGTALVLHPDAPAEAPAPATITVAELQVAYSRQIERMGIGSRDDLMGSRVRTRDGREWLVAELHSRSPRAAWTDVTLISVATGRTRHLGLLRRTTTFDVA